MNLVSVDRPPIYRNRYAYQLMSEDSDQTQADGLTSWAEIAEDLRDEGLWATSVGWISAWLSIAAVMLVCVAVVSNAWLVGAMYAAGCVAIAFLAMPILRAYLAPLIAWYSSLGLSRREYDRLMAEFDRGEIDSTNLERSMRPQLGGMLLLPPVIAGALGATLGALAGAVLPCVMALPVSPAHGVIIGGTFCYFCLSSLMIPAAMILWQRSPDPIPKLTWRWRFLIACSPVLILPALLFCVRCAMTDFPGGDA